MRLEQLNEGLRFGAREVSRVLKNRDLRIGFEFEYHVNTAVAIEFMDGGEPMYGIGSDSPNTDKYKLVEIIDNVLATNSSLWGINYDDISNVVIDPSVVGGVEVITKPMKILDAVQMLKGMTDHIKSLGNTSNKTGLHTNISIKGLTNTEARHPNILKLVMLSDERIINDLFGVRGYVESMFNQPELARQLHSEFNSLPKRMPAGEVIIQVMTDAIRKHKKFQRINLSHIRHYDSIERRIEFRFLGDKDYEKSYNTLWHFVAKAAYATMLSYTDEFDREYFKATADFADHLLKTHRRTSIGEIRKINLVRGKKDAELLDKLFNDVKDIDELLDT